VTTLVTFNADNWKKSSIFWDVTWRKVRSSLPYFWGSLSVPSSRVKQSKKKNISRRVTSEKSKGLY